jgi:cyanophycinase-like exopeptidase
MAFPAPWIIGLVLLCIVLAAIPTRRLADAGIRPGWLIAYLLTLVALGVAVVVERPWHGSWFRSSSCSTSRRWSSRRTGPRAGCGAGGCRRRTSAPAPDGTSVPTTTRRREDATVIAGTLALHGGGEFLPGDESFLRTCLDAARPTALLRAAGAPTGAGLSPRDDPGAIRIAIVPAAAARQRPDLAALHGVDAFARVAAAAGLPAHPYAVMVVDAASADSAGLAEHLADADLIHLPGGDPGRLLEILAGSAAWGAILAALGRGAVLAGASAGAMVLADWTWTPGGWRRGLGLVPGVVVVPHAERVARGGWAGTFGGRVPAEAEPIGRLGLDERTGVIRTVQEQPGSWRVVGPGSVHWSPDATTPPRSVAAPGELDFSG